MATRFAGDFFGIPLVEKDESRSSLLDYFPSLRTISKNQGSEQEGPRSFGGAKAVSPFVGFKTFEASSTPKKAVPLFTGFKTPEFKRN